jgi:uncharacterized protein YoxC
MGFIELTIDILIVVLLAATIFYAVRLSFHLRNFRQNRKELDKLINNLNNEINKAHKAIEGLRTTSQEAGEDLQEKISRAQGLSEELQLMNEAGDNLAVRLEKLAERNRTVAGAIEAHGLKAFESHMGGRSVSGAYEGTGAQAGAGHDRRQTPSQPSEPARETYKPFQIRDPEYVRGEHEDDHSYARADGLFANESSEFDEATYNNLKSQAEKDLYAALHTNKRSSGSSS